MYVYMYILLQCFLFFFSECNYVLEAACAHDRSICIRRNKVCDGFSDCVDHSDEWFCREYTRTCIQYTIYYEVNLFLTGMMLPL